jgi:hypothetical protein
MCCGPMWSHLSVIKNSLKAFDNTEKEKQIQLNLKKLPLHDVRLNKL